MSHLEGVLSSERVELGRPGAARRRCGAAEEADFGPHKLQDRRGSALIAHRVAPLPCPHLGRRIYLA
ncbi:hypothetical protein NDU88_004278 [Pleurodeles waltl]|uniref:Uncharacterized protein n=1 Tax=Pleurodeles waltl TaxID=8319 RepID=A0AAV7M7S7_PLEWA|nr:hypothetical protein NDU88_004278 [Pleurodeles waltl]